MAGKETKVLCLIEGRRRGWDQRGGRGRKGREEGKLAVGNGLARFIDVRQYCHINTLLSLSMFLSS